MKNVIKKNWLTFTLTLSVLLVSFVVYSLVIVNRNLYLNAEIAVASVDQIPHIGAHLKEIESEGDIRYVEKKTLGTIEILFTGCISSESFENLSASNEWDYISAAASKESLGNIYKDFKVAKEDYPISYTEEDIMFGRPLFENIKLKINYIPSQKRFTGKATIYNR